MSETMPYGQMVQELSHLRAQYEQFIIDRERERIIKLLEDEELETHPNNLMANYDKLVWLGIKEQLIQLIKLADSK